MPRWIPSTVVVAFAVLALVGLPQAVPLVASGQAPTGPEVAAPDDPPPASVMAPAAAATPVPGGPGYVMVNAAAFVPDNPNNTTPTFGFGWLQTAAGTSFTYHAPVALPDRAQVTGFTLYYNDNDAVASILARLRQHSVCENIGQTMAAVTTDAQAPANWTQALTDTTIIVADVDQRCTSYWLYASIPVSSNLALYSVRIDYAFVTALPAVVK